MHRLERTVVRDAEGFQVDLQQMPAGGMGNDAMEESLVGYRMESGAGDDLAADQTRVLARYGGIDDGCFRGARVFFVQVERAVAEVGASRDADRDAFGWVAASGLERADCIPGTLQGREGSGL